MNINTSNHNKIIDRIKNNPIISLMMLFSAFIVSIATFTDSFKNLNEQIESVFELDQEELDGYWVIEETNNTPKTYLYFIINEDSIVGESTILYDNYDVHMFAMPVTTTMQDLKIKKNSVNFKTIRNYQEQPWDKSPINHTATIIYQGNVNKDTINFIVKNESRYIEKCVAKKIDDQEAKKLLKTEFKKKYRININ